MRFRFILWSLLLVLVGHLVDGGLGAGPSKIVNAPGGDPFHKEYMQGRTTRQTYSDAGQKWDWSNNNYMFTTFEVTSGTWRGSRRR